MKLVTVRTDAGTSAGRIEGDQIVVLPFADVGDLLTSGDDWAHRGAQDGTAVPLSDARLAPVVPSPPKVFCVGRNYLLHVREGGKDVPTHPSLFSKFTEALTGPYDDIVIPSASEKVDWEAELVVVIGRSIRAAEPAAAAAAIAGFTIGNDVSMRDWQFRTDSGFQGKTWEASAPVGPALVTLDEIGSATPDLAISCLVDGELMQESRTSNLVFDVPELVSYCSTIITLRPGDLIFTGTPEGVGAARKPPVFLKNGQVVSTRIEGLGEMRNRFVAE